MIFSPERDEFIHDVRFQLRLSLTLSEALSHVVAFCFDTYGSLFLSGPMILYSQVINLFCLAFPNKRLPSAYLSPHSSPLTTNPLCLCSCHSSPRFAPVCYCLLLCAAYVWFCHSGPHIVSLITTVCYCVLGCATMYHILPLCARFWYYLSHSVTDAKREGTRDG